VAFAAALKSLVCLDRRAPGQFEMALHVHRRGPQLLPAGHRERRAEVLARKSLKPQQEQHPMKRILLAAAALALLIPAAQAQSSSDLACRTASDLKARLEAPPMPIETARQREVAGTFARLRERDERSLKSSQEQCEQLKREEAERTRQHYAEQAERERQMQEQATAAAERRQQQAEADRAQAVIEAKPSTRLYRGYQRYAFVKFCNDVRQGYAVQYVNDVELERAGKVIKALAAQTSAEDASIDTDDLWKQTLRSLEGKSAHDVMCKNTLIALFNMSPTPVYQIAKP
jgi:Skp family chaperone for outer membrane proteins